MRIVSYVVKVLAVIGILASVTAVHADQLAKVQQRGVLNVAVPQDFPPFGSIGTDMQPHGYDIDMATYLAKQLKVKLNLVPVTSANRIPYLQTGKVDLVISSMGKNASRAKVINFSDAYAPFYLGVFGSDDENVADAKQLSGKTIGVTRGSVEDLVLSDIAPSNAHIKRFEDNNSTLSAYLSGQVRLIATGNLVVTEIANRYPEKAPKTKFMLKNSPCYVGVMKGEPALLNKVNALIKQAKSQGVLNQLSEKWLKAPFPKSLGA
ncbi:MAG: transporter substrate-binding domain-containing protein [Vibrio sp.]